MASGPEDRRVVSEINLFPLCPFLSLSVRFIYLVVASRRTTNYRAALIENYCNYVQGRRILLIPGLGGVTVFKLGIARESG